MEKEITQIGQPKTVAYLDTKEQGKIKLIIFSYFKKLRQKDKNQNIK